MSDIYDSETHLESISRCQLTASSHFNVSLRTYKTVKSLTQLSGVAAGIYALAEGADPMATFAIIGAIIVGPEFLEYTWASEERGDDDASS